MILDVRPDFLKLDRYFVDSCDSDPNRRAVIESVANLAAHFGAAVIAEGVESQEVVEALGQFGVELMQGYLFAKPLRADAAAEFMLLH
jgi:EAL domain-containing protein (putative c-di-GMP-specific phosphodiesterase class I)